MAIHLQTTQYPATKSHAISSITIPPHIGGGRKRLPRSLYMAAFTGAFNWNPELQALYKQLLARGKDHKCATIACARKLLIYANTVLARGTPWEKNRPLTAA